MRTTNIRSRALVGLFAGGIGFATIAAPSQAEAHHLSPTQHKATDFSVTLRLAGKDAPVEYGSHQYFEARSGSRLVFDAVMSNDGFAQQSVDDGDARTHLKVTLPPSLANFVVPETDSDVCTVTTIAAQDKLPGTIIKCQASSFALNGRNAELLYPGEPRSVRFEATAPRDDGKHRLTATIGPVKYWDSAPGNNSVTAHLAITRKPRYEEVLVTPRPDVAPDVVVDSDVRVVPRPSINPCAITAEGC